MLAPAILLFLIKKTNMFYKDKLIFGADNRIEKIFPQTTVKYMDNIFEFIHLLSIYLLYSELCLFNTAYLHSQIIKFKEIEKRLGGF